MAKKKQSKKLNKNYIAIGLICLVAGAALGFLGGKQLYQENKYVKVWAADDTVTVPTDLINYLETESKDDCKAYAGDNSPRGVTLYAVTKVVGDSYAKMSYGCAGSLTNDPGIVSVKQDNKWSLIQPVEYYRTESKPTMTDGTAVTLPKCSQLQKYGISKEAEPECLNVKDRVKSNPNQ